MKLGHFCCFIQLNNINCELHPTVSRMLQPPDFKVTCLFLLSFLSIKQSSILTCISPIISLSCPLYDTLLRSKSLNASYLLISTHGVMQQGTRPNWSTSTKTVHLHLSHQPAFCFLSGLLSLLASCFSHHANWTVVPWFLFLSFAFTVGLHLLYSYLCENHSRIYKGRCGNLAKKKRNRIWIHYYSSSESLIISKLMKMKEWQNIWKLL